MPPDPMTTPGRSASWSGLRPASYRSSRAARCAPARREPNLSWCQRRNPSSQRRYLIAAKAISIPWSATAIPGPPKVWYWCGRLSASQLAAYTDLNIRSRFSPPAESLANHRFLSGDRPIQSPAVRRSPVLRCEISHTVPLRFPATCGPASFGLVQRSSLTDGACPRHLSNTSDPAAEILAHHVQAGGLL